MAELSYGVKLWGEVKEFVSSMKKARESVQELQKKTYDSFSAMGKDMKQAENKFKNMAAQFGVNSPQAKEALKGLAAIKEKYAEINDAARNAGKDTSFFQSMKGNIGGLVVGFGALTGGVMAAKGAFDAVIGVMSMTDDGAVEVQARMAGVGGALNAIKDRAAEVLTGMRPVKDLFSGLGDNMLRAAEAADEYVRAMDRINDRSAAFVAQEARMRNEIAKLQYAAKDQTKSEGERKTALEKSLELEREIVDFKQTQAKKAYEMEVMALSKRHMISHKVIKYIIEQDRERVEDAVKNNKRASEAWNKLYGSGGEGEKLSKLYADYINLDTEYFEQNKRTQSQLSGFKNKEITQVEKLKSGVDDLTQSVIKYQQAYFAGQIVGPGFNTPSDSGTIGAAVGEAGQLGRMESKGATLPGGMPSMSLTGKTSPAESFADQWASAVEKVKGSLSGFSSYTHGLFDSISDVIGKASEGFVSGWNDAVQSIGGMVQNAIGFVSELFTAQSTRRIQELDAQYNKQKETIEMSQMSEEEKSAAIDRLDKNTAKKRKEMMRQQAKDQKTASLMQAIVAGALAVVQAFSAGPGIGLVLGLLMTGLVAAQIASIASQPLPALAEGGLAYAPTMALIGDNPNARIDPEVISPLSKLRGLMEGGEMTLTHRVSGDDLLFIVERAGRRKGRIV